MENNFGTREGLREGLKSQRIVSACVCGTRDRKKNLKRRMGEFGTESFVCLNLKVYTKSS